MTRRNIYAFTPATGDHPPPYLSINEEEDGTVSFTVRSEPFDAGEVTEGMERRKIWVNHEAMIGIKSKEELCNCFLALGEYLYGEEIMTVTGKVIFQLVTAPESVVNAAADIAVDTAEALTEQKPTE